MNSKQPPFPLLSGCFEDSFAYSTLKDRLPDILTKVIDSISRKETRLSSNSQSKLINLISGLKYELTRGKKLKVKMDDVVEMEKESLEELEVDTNDPIEMAWKCEIDGLLEREIGTWFTAPWLTVECLMYKHIQDFTVVATATFQSTQGQPYDVFEHLKMEAMEASMVVMAEIGDQFLHGILKSPDNDASLQKLVEFSLWGNQADLSWRLSRFCFGCSSYFRV